MPQSFDRRFRFRIIAGVAMTMLAASVPAQGVSELIVIEDPHCAPCQRFERQVGTHYPLTDVARSLPIRRLPLDGYEAAGLRVERPIHRAPTFLIVENQVEQHRFEGYSSDELFWMTLESLVAR
ncbi:MAG: hypothetical protein K0Q76_3789 [Panacagrimonas sp.]|jgi:hypothetical protein|nr:hypothetical protein [Panacagrimonas sp.]MCC2658681.1 hypothetical protein [Panacagrimonas sp.]